MFVEVLNRKLHGVSPVVNSNLSAAPRHPRLGLARSAAASCTAEMAERVVRCWGCGKEPDEEAPRFKYCAWCAKAKLPATLFCSHECYKNNWPSHKEWHEAQQKMQAVREESGQLQRTRAVAEEAARDAEASGSPYEQELAVGLRWAAWAPPGRGGPAPLQRSRRRPSGGDALRK